VHRALPDYEIDTLDRNDFRAIFREIEIANSSRFDKR